MIANSGVKAYWVLSQRQLDLFPTLHAFDHLVYHIVGNTEAVDSWNGLAMFGRLVRASQGQARLRYNEGRHFEG